ncbi:ATP phosphoribosyltransferase [Pyrolobus fumarii 1A]|uniref:ATP phosphoribosyltransferase n=1 Tax=Pyrolobus fumarii (strain DSM 11204 / 1A) TaxID=694429 RepID=G0EH85_PYRF1|nr:ATP phosphoribosyltransferase [Pyrolobus fumarii]AEM39309.1 ATP phosphoribosyltransferase [Pyrolobus fumarii 1A]
MVTIRFAIPSKGRLLEPTLKLLEAAGIKPLYTDDRALMLPTKLDWVTLVRLRAEDIPSVVESCAADLGITGLDFVKEYDADVEVFEDLGFGRARLVVAVPESSGYERVEDLPDGVRVATKYVNIARKFFEEKGIRARIVRVSGSTEVMPLLGAADAILDVVSTGTTLAIHKLRPIATVMETSARLIACKKSLQGPKARLVTSIVELIRSVLEAQKKKLVLMNVPERLLSRVLEVLPAMAGPTVARIERTPEPMVEVMIVVDEDELPETILAAKERGARDIVVVPIEKVTR